MNKGRFEEQARKAKEFYETGILNERLEVVTNSQEELKIMIHKLSNYSNYDDSCFVYLGAGTGRFINELNQIFNPKSVIAIDIANNNIKELYNNIDRSKKNIVIKQENFFDTNFKKINKEQIFIFMNWTVLSEVGSKEGLEYLLQSINSFSKRKIIIGDLPFQEEYMDSILAYADQCKTSIQDLGILEFTWGENSKHKLYLPNKNQLIQIFQNHGFKSQNFVDYRACNQQKRYIFEFKSNM